MSFVAVLDCLITIDTLDMSEAVLALFAASVSHRYVGFCGSELGSGSGGFIYENFPVTAQIQPTSIDQNTRCQGPVLVLSR